MAILDNGFTCPNGHSFRANAKLRTRCSECGTLARRDFAKVEDEKPKPIEDKKVEAKETKEPKEQKKPVLLRQGRPRMPKSIAKPKPPVKGKVSGGLVKRHRVIGKAAPGITKLPRKTNRARITETARGGDKPYWKQVAERYGL